MPPFQPVVFVLHSANEDNQQEAEGLIEKRAALHCGDSVVGSVLRRGQEEPMHVEATRAPVRGLLFAAGSS